MIIAMVIIFIVSNDYGELFYKSGSDVIKMLIGMLGTD